MIIFILIESVLVSKHDPLRPPSQRRKCEILYKREKGREDGLNKDGGLK